MIERMIFAHMDVKINECDTCTHYQPRISYCEYYLRGKEIAVYLCPHCRSKNEEMQEVAIRDFENEVIHGVDGET